MKKRIILFLIVVSFSNCNQKETSTIIIENISEKETKIEKKSAANLNSEKNTISEIKNIEIDLDTLIPLEVLNEKSKNIYEKYGLEFSGNCYACDLAQIEIENRNISISNVCDNENKINLKILNLEKTETQIIIETQKAKFIFLKIPNEPIYTLKIIDGTFENENLRISKYFTAKKNLSKFEVHDCCDFEG